MATRDVDVTANPTNVVTSLGLTIGTRYALQNVDSNARILYREAAVKPAPTMRGHVIEPMQFHYPTPATNVGFWVWTPSANGCKAVITEAD